MKQMLNFVAAVLAIGVMSAAHADPIGTTENPCSNDSCFGNVFTLQYEEVGGSDTHYLVHLLIDTSGYSGAGDSVSDVAFKIVPQWTDMTSYSLTAAPGGVGLWALQTGGINAAGCSGSGNGFLCVNDGANTGAPLPFAGVYEWIFDIVVADADSWKFSSSSVDARYGIRGNLTSEPITLQPYDPPELPEPGTLALVALALAIMAAAKRAGSIAAARRSRAPATEQSQRPSA